MVENANQNQINATQERLDEMKAIKAENQKVLDDINAKGSALTRDKAAFEEYKNSENTRIEGARKLLARESANHAKLDTVVMQGQIDVLTAQVDALTKTNADLTAHFTAQVDALKKA